MKIISSIFPELPESLRLQRLELPAGRINAVLDTDTFNEIDDQFALSLAMLSPEKLNMLAITAAPFLNFKVTTPAEGMGKSYREIFNVLEMLEIKKDDFVFKGSENYLPDTFTPVESPAARRIVQLAQEAAAKDEVLYVFAIGAITNVASALLMAPEIIRNIVIVWLGGHDVYAPENNEFNLYQDIAASQVIFDSGVPLVWVPCIGAAEMLLTTLEEIGVQTAKCGKIGNFLNERSKEYLHNDPAARKVIWDISVIIYCTRPELMKSVLLPAPVLADDSSWHEAEGRHTIKKVTFFDSDKCFEYLYDVLGKAPR